MPPGFGELWPGINKNPDHLITGCQDFTLIFQIIIPVFTG